MNKKVDEEYEGIKDVYILQCICSELKSQLQQKENIIKEVREKIKNTQFAFDFEREINAFAFDLTFTKEGRELLEILEKEN